jgi:Spy/CpxP family protein refolding chaperone
MKNLTLALVLLMMSSLATAAGANKGEKKARGEKMRQELGLSTEQLAKMKEIRKERKSTIKESRERVKAAKAEFQIAMANPASTSDELKAKFNTLSEARQSAQKARFETMLEVRSILDEKQIVKFQALRKEKQKGLRPGRC